MSGEGAQPPFSWRPATPQPFDFDQRRPGAPVLASSTEDAS